MAILLATDRSLAILTIEQEQCGCELHLADRNAQCVAIDPMQPELVFCGTFGDGLWQSDDDGRNWRRAGEGITHANVTSVAVSRLERAGGQGVVYAGTEPSAIFRSEDGGKTWIECHGLTDLPSSSEWSFPPRPDTHHVRWIHTDPHIEGRLFAAIEAGALVRSTDGGSTWSDRVPTGPIDTHQLTTHLPSHGRLYSAAGDGYFESIDAGDTWRQLEEGLKHRYVWSVAVDAGDADTRLISSAASARKSHDKNDSESFIYRRTENTTWQEIRNGLPQPSGRRTALLAAHPREAGTFFAAWESEFFRSTDGGKSWTELNVPWPAGFQVNQPRVLVVTAAT